MAIEYIYTSNFFYTLKKPLTINFIANIVGNIILYVSLIISSKKQIEQNVLGKEEKKSIYKLLYISAILIILSTLLFYDSNNPFNINAVYINNSTIAKKYKNAKWEKEDLLNRRYSGNEDRNEPFDFITMYVGNRNFYYMNYDKDQLKTYKAKKEVCIVYKKGTDIEIGRKEFYYENIDKYSYKTASLIMCATPFISKFNVDYEFETYVIRE